MNVYVVTWGYLILINIVAFILMGDDKRRARKRAFRIPESTFFIVAAIGGCVGAIAGMHIFRHKTRHWYFLFGMPAILALQIIIVVLLYFAPVKITFL